MLSSSLANQIWLAAQHQQWLFRVGQCFRWFTTHSKSLGTLGVIACPLKPTETQSSLKETPWGSDAQVILISALDLGKFNAMSGCLGHGECQNFSKWLVLKCMDEHVCMCEYHMCFQCPQRPRWCPPDTLELGSWAVVSQTKPRMSSKCS